MYSNTIMFFKLYSGDWISIVFLFLFAMLGVAKILFEKRFNLLIRNLVNNKYFSEYVVDKALIFNYFNILFFVINTFTISLLLFFIVEKYYSDLVVSRDITLYFQIVFFVVTFRLLKQISVIILSFLTKKTALIKIFIFSKLGFESMISILLFALLVINFYFNKESDLGLMLSALVFLVVSTIGYVVSAFRIFNVKNDAILYMLLYLCAFEIAPILIYIKLIFIYLR